MVLTMEIDQYATSTAILANTWSDSRRRRATHEFIENVEASVNEIEHNFDATHDDGEPYD